MTDAAWQREDEMEEQTRDEGQQLAEQPEEPTPQGAQAGQEEQADAAAEWKASSRKWERRAKESQADARKLQGRLDEMADYDEIRRQLADLRTRNEALEAERERQRQVREAAAANGVDAALLERMSGDVEENARFLRTLPIYPNVRDDGEQRRAGAVSRESIDKIKDPVERLKTRAAHLDIYDNM